MTKEKLLETYLDMIDYNYITNEDIKRIKSYLIYLK